MPVTYWARLAFSSLDLMLSCARPVSQATYRQTDNLQAPTWSGAFETWESRSGAATLA